MGEIGNHRLVGSVTVDLEMGDGPVEVFWRRMSLSDMDRIEQAQSRGTVALVVESVLLRSRHENGTRMFQDKDREKVELNVNPDAASEIVNAMAESDNESGN